MRQIVHEHPDLLLGRFLHVRKPNFITWNVEPRQFVRPGLLGGAPLIDFDRQPRPVHSSLHGRVYPDYPLHGRVYPDAIFARQHEHVQTLDPRLHEHVWKLDSIQSQPPPQGNFLQLAWLKGIQQDMTLRSHPRKSATHGSRKRKQCSNAPGVRKCLRKMVKNGISQGDDVQASRASQEEAVESIVVEETKARNRANEQDERLRFKEVASDELCAIGEQAETLIEDLEEGEIPSGSPERYCTVDIHEAFQQMEEVKDAEVTTGLLASDNAQNVQQCNLDIELADRLSVESLASQESGDKQSVDMDNCFQHDILCDEKDVHETAKPDHVGVNSSKDSVSTARLDETGPDSTTIQSFDSSMPTESLDVLNANREAGTCENFDDKAMVAQVGGERSVQPPLPSLETEKGSLNCRDPKKRAKTGGFPEFENLQHVAPSKNITEKRKHITVDLLETPSKRLCSGKENTCQPIPRNQSNCDVSVQQPIDMEIDSLDPVAPVPNTARTLDNIDDERDSSLQNKPTSSEPLSVVNPSKLKLRSRDPRKALMHGSNSGRIFPSVKDSPVAGSKSEENSCDFGKRLEGVMCTSRSAEEITSWENTHFEGLSNQEREAIYVERARRIDEQNRMLNSGKLCMVLDLDHTLLNSAKFSEVDEKLRGVLHEMEAGGRRNTNGQSARKDLYCYPNLGMWTKLRPGVWDFLSRASKLYELHVYTMGNKAYATEMAKLLDPTGTLFAGRIISRGDDNERAANNELVPKSKDLDGVLGLESAVIIIDDSVNVWPHHRHNLLVVERYVYFPSSRRQFGLPGPSLLEIRHDERAADGMLASVLKVIERIHHSFFLNEWLHEVDVRRILMVEKRSILAGCKIVFSRVYPQGEAHPHLHPLWQTAEQFGAVCTTNIDDDVTHVVAISRGTEKVKWAIRSGRFSVSPAWLEASAVLYRRANEVDFPVPL